ncbi:MAG: prolipoprotein diacylglyceryl transferase [Candidatus Limnocylindrales bacterium]
MAPALAVIRLEFDPLLRLRWPGGPDLAIPWQSVLVAVAVFLALLVAARFARRSGARTGLPRLRPDDLLVIAIAIIPGALIGGRIVHGLDYLDYYRLDPARLLDPSEGSLSLLGAVIGGTLSGSLIARLVESSPARWADVASTSLLLALGVGKVAQFAAGGGQGLPWDGPLAVAFSGPGPWLSVAPGTPAVPSQLLEAGWALLGIPVLLALHAGPLLRSLPDGLRQVGAWAEARRLGGAPVAEGRLRFGYLFALAVSWWLVGRVVIASTWRDDRLVGPLNVEQALGLAVLAILVLGALFGGLRRPKAIAEVR